MTDVLFVCTGNTCRSVMAEGIYNKLAGHNCAKSAGIAANPDYNIFGALAKILDEKGIPYADHVSTQVSAEVMDDAAVVLAMENIHREYLRENFPESADKIYLLTEFTGETGGVPDPIGRPEEYYRRTFDRISGLVAKVFRKIGEKNV